MNIFNEALLPLQKRGGFPIPLLVGLVVLLTLLAIGGFFMGPILSERSSRRH
jgi:hypothetical protein